MRSSLIDSDRTYDSSCSQNSSDRRRFSSSAMRWRSRSTEAKAPAHPPRQPDGGSGGREADPDEQGERHEV